MYMSLPSSHLLCLFLSLSHSLPCLFRIVHLCTACVAMGYSLKTTLTPLQEAIFVASMLVLIKFTLFGNPSSEKTTRNAGHRTEKDSTRTVCLMGKDPASRMQASH